MRGSGVRVTQAAPFPIITVHPGIDATTRAVLRAVEVGFEKTLAVISGRVVILRAQ
tara:strand:- start:1379 stop:1546 length:168 start_codon:yes stop_codon:yes gene_type:complete